MHELGITRNVVAICSERAAGNRVLRVTLEIGTLSAVMPDALRFCFDVCAKGTPLEGALLDVVEIPGRARCEDCGGEVAMASLSGQCACGSRRLRLFAGEELKIREMEVA